MFTKSDIKFAYPTVQYFLDDEIEMNNIRLYVAENGDSLSIDVCLHIQKACTIKTPGRWLNL